MHGSEENGGKGSNLRRGGLNCWEERMDLNGIVRSHVS